MLSSLHSALVQGCRSTAQGCMACVEEIERALLHRSIISGKRAACAPIGRITPFNKNKGASTTLEPSDGWPSEGFTARPT